MIALSLAMDSVVFRPLRTQSPAVMLVATFAVAFLLQSIALLAFGPLGKPASSLGYLNRPVTIGSVDIRKITIVAIVVAAVCLVAVVLLLERTTVGPAHAGCVDGLPHRQAPGRQREPRDRLGRPRLRRCSRRPSASS